MRWPTRLKRPGPNGQPPESSQLASSIGISLKRFVHVAKIDLPTIREEQSLVAHSATKFDRVRSKQHDFRLADKLVNTLVSLLLKLRVNVSNPFIHQQYIG